MPETTPTALAFGTILRKRRKKRGLTQEDLAEAADVHWKYISLLERGLRQPSLDVLLRLAKSLDASASELVAEVEQDMGTSDSGAF